MLENALISRIFQKVFSEPSQPGSINNVSALATAENEPYVPAVLNQTLKWKLSHTIPVANSCVGILEKEKAEAGEKSGNLILHCFSSEEHISAGKTVQWASSYCLRLRKRKLFLAKEKDE